MAIENPVTSSGSDLRAYRDLYGIRRTDVATRLGKHRNTLAAWEKAQEVDAVNVLAYRRAVDALAREKLDALGVTA